MCVCACVCVCVCVYLDMCMCVYMFCMYVCVRIGRRCVSIIRNRITRLCKLLKGTSLYR